MKNCKKINTDAIRKNASSWSELCVAVLKAARSVPEVTIDSELLEELFEHCFNAGYLEATHDAFTERKQEALEIGIDIGMPLEPLEDPYPYHRK